MNVYIGLPQGGGVVYALSWPVVVLQRTCIYTCVFSLTCIPFYVFHFVLLSFLCIAVIVFMFMSSVYF